MKLSTETEYYRKHFQELEKIHNKQVEEMVLRETELRALVLKN